MNRRRFLALLGSTALAGCTARSVSPDSAATTGASGSDGGSSDLPDPTAHLDGKRVYAADGLGVSLPGSATRAESPADADIAVFADDPATAERRGAALVRGGTPVAFVGQSGDRALLALLEAVGDEFRYGLEWTPHQTPIAAAVPRGSSLDTHAYPDGTVPDHALGWTLGASRPSPDPAAPTPDERWTHLGLTHTAERSGDVGYAVWTDGWSLRTKGRRYLRTRTVQRVRSASLPVDSLSRFVDIADDLQIESRWPGTTTRDDATIGETVGPTGESSRTTFDLDGAPTEYAAATALRIDFDDDALGYDFVENYDWRRENLLGDRTATASRSGRGEWHPRGPVREGKAYARS